MHKLQHDLRVDFLSSLFYKWTGSKFLKDIHNFVCSTSSCSCKVFFRILSETTNSCENIMTRWSRDKGTEVTWRHAWLISSLCVTNMLLGCFVYSQNSFKPSNYHVHGPVPSSASSYLYRTSYMISRRTGQCLDGHRPRFQAKKIPWFEIACVCPICMNNLF